MPINQPVQLNGIRVMFVAHVFSHVEVALEDRDGRRFEDKGSCQHVPWQAVERGITRDPNEEPQNV